VRIVRYALRVVRRELRWWLTDRRHDLARGYAAFCRWLAIALGRVVLGRRLYDALEAESRRRYVNDRIVRRRVERILRSERESNRILN
jgi:hypothetical protein